MARTPKPLSEARANFDAASATVRPRYEAGVKRGEWEDATVSQQAEDNYQTGLAEATAANRRQTGVREVGDAGWRAGALDKGAPIIAQRMRESADKYATNFEPVYNAIVSTVRALPARTLDVQQNVTMRLLPVVMAAHRAGKRGGS